MFLRDILLLQISFFQFEVKCNQVVKFPKENQKDFADFMEKYGKKELITDVKFIMVETVDEVIPDVIVLLLPPSPPLSAALPPFPSLLDFVC